VSFVHNDGLVLEEVLTAECLTQQHAVCHVLDDGLVRGAVLKTDGVTNLQQQQQQQLLQMRSCVPACVSKVLYQTQTQQQPCTRA
jgi:hypothetical protein